MIISRPCTDRHRSFVWAFPRLPTAIGLESFEAWSKWAHAVLDDADLIEEWILNNDEPIGYFAYQDGYCIHHYGKILDIQMLVLAPHSRDTRRVWKEILRVADYGGYKWIARRQHQSDGSIKTIFTEV